MKLMISLFFSVMIFSTLPAQAQMGFGGGCIVQGEICEKEDYLHLEKLNIEPVLQEVEKIGQSLKLFDVFARNLAAKKKWYLEDRPFNPELCAPQGISLPSDNYEIAACQSPIEVRISKNYWARASELQKRDLLIHELMVMYFLKQEKSLALARSASYLLTSDSYWTGAVRNQLFELGLPFFSVDLEVSYFVDFVSSEFNSICGTEVDDMIYSRAYNYMSLRIDNIATLRNDYQSVFYEGLEKVIKLGRADRRNCQSPAILSSLAEMVHYSFPFQDF